MGFLTVAQRIKIDVYGDRLMYRRPWRGLSVDQKAIIAVLEAELDKDRAMPASLFRGGRREQWFIARCLRERTEMARQSLFRALLRLVAREQIQCDIIRPSDYGGRFQRHPETRPPSKTRHRPIRLYAAKSAPRLDQLPR